MQFMTLHMVVLQFFERPKELMDYEQSDDLLFFVVNEAYQVRLASHDRIPHRSLHI